MAAPTTTDAKCQSCKSSPGKWCCQDCVGSQLLCGLCCRNRHALLIYHRVERWNGRYYHSRALWETGVKLYLGHNGLPCPESTSNAGLPLNDDVGGGMQPLEGYNLGPNPPTTFEDSFYATAFEEVGPDAEDEGNEEEDSLEDLKNSQTNLVLQPSSRDQSGNPFIAIIDVSGVHHLPVVHCTCRRAEDDILFLEMGLFPASFNRIRTVFTFNVLTDFRLSNLECKTSAYQYYQKL
ncbi:hypothetical protein CPB84DRAFT_1690262 [Gymnopilus junonius]|uniref:CxC2-like cysteine cluster KDZ transposase-associated domain-containing protein n=1 Tax=Gymnopilus junonius TaxID=109634 RepID=A0A9P5TGD1_GYMJU|nr:hypothetical protein CPB84DRAFT_1690262 [Gymnopilus junonius]